jgi:hypothetical protein
MEFNEENKTARPEDRAEAPQTGERKRHLTSAERQQLYAEHAKHRTQTAAGKKRRQKIITVSLIVILTLLIAGLVTALIILDRNVWKPARTYAEAEEYYAMTEYLKAYDIFKSLGDYSDSAERAAECVILNARKLSGREDPVIGYSSDMKWFSLYSDSTSGVTEDMGYIKFDSSLYKGDGNVVIPDIFNGVLVRGIADKCFFWCDFLTSVEIPASVTVIGERAFYSCSELTSVVIPDSVAVIGENAFAECVKLESVKIGSGLSELPPRCFRNCVSLGSVELPEGLTAIGVRSFNGCTGLKELTLPSTLSFLGNNAFTGCTALESVIYAGTREKLAALCAADDGSILLDCPGLVTGG